MKFEDDIGVWRNDQVREVGRCSRGMADGYYNLGTFYLVAPMRIRLQVIELLTP